MARLWINTKTDLRKGTGKGASEVATVGINWGSAGDSKRAAEISVMWPKDQQFPTVSVLVGEKENPLPEDKTRFTGHFSPPSEMDPRDREALGDPQC